jgi:hypothetical protein
MNLEIKNETNKTRRMYVTHVSKFLYYNYTKPCISIEKSIIAAENMICSAVMEEEGKDWTSITHFTSTLRRDYPESVKKAQQHIGETIEVEVPIKLTPREYRIWFCSATCDESITEGSV